MDDTLLYDTSVEEEFCHACSLETCTHVRVTLKPEKFSFCRKEVNFVSFHLN